MLRRPALIDVGYRRGLIETGTPGSENTTLNIHQRGKMATIATQMAIVHLSTVQTVASEMRRRASDALLVPVAFDRATDTSMFATSLILHQLSCGARTS